MVLLQIQGCTYWVDCDPSNENKATLEREVHQAIRKFGSYNDERYDHWSVHDVVTEVRQYVDFTITPIECWQINT